MHINIYLTKHDVKLAVMAEYCFCLFVCLRTEMISF